MADDGETLPGAVNSPPPSPPISLAAIGPSSGGNGGSGSSSPGTATAVTPDYSLDKTRQNIAFFLLGILGFIILIELISSGILATGCWSSAITDAKTGAVSCPQAQASLGVLTSVLGTVFTAMVGLVGSVVGFYFGSQKQT
jgi:hypothetical protein